MKRIGIDLDYEQHRKIKILCAKEGKTMREFCVIAINERMESLCAEKKQKL